eukprot:CAMPEP_0179433540 /NCGR_PEP_ID=MMETSP0799-20121207/17943_1 /TAXON_ID=46947 /ORGANISM="Geminigera cryophila, Strain CCMP2564" /LENGTH=183 /DNA_ID=CAMNT_0021211599 /DNA_START=32 /DNA_END=583 /DNA_ORIENTATION=+
MFELAIAQLALSNAGTEATALATAVTAPDGVALYGCQPDYYAYPAYGYYDPCGYAYSYPLSGYYDPYGGYYYAYPASYGYTYYTYAEVPAQQLALPVMQELPQAKDSAYAIPADAAHKASPGHLLLCAHAMLLGAAMATQDVLSGKDDVANFKRSFQDQSNAAANSMSPVGAYVLKQHVFQVE